MGKRAEQRKCRVLPVHDQRNATCRGEELINVARRPANFPKAGSISIGGADLDQRQGHTRIPRRPTWSSCHCNTFENLVEVAETPILRVLNYEQLPRNLQLFAGLTLGTRHREPRSRSIPGLVLLRHQARADGVIDVDADDRDAGRRLPRRQNGGAGSGHDHVGRQADQLLRQRRQAGDIAVGITVREYIVAPFDVAQVSQALRKTVVELPFAAFEPPPRKPTVGRLEKTAADAPKGRSAAAPPRSVRRTRAASFDHLVGAARAAAAAHARPSVLAALRLMTNSNLLDCMTGRSRGLGALEDAARRSGRARR